MLVGVGIAKRMNQHFVDFAGFSGWRFHQIEAGDCHDKVFRKCRLCRQFDKVTLAETIIGNNSHHIATLFLAAGEGTIQTYLLCFQPDGQILHILNGYDAHSQCF